MENQVEKFDPSRLMEGVKDRVKATFVSLIPDTEWEEMIKKEINTFFKGNTSINWNERYCNNISPFQKLVLEELTKEFKSRMIDFLSSPEFDHLWLNYGRPTCSKAVEKAIIDNSGDILVAMFGGLFSDMIMRFKQQLMERRY